MDELISRQAAIDALDEIRHALCEMDIPSPTVPEYVEHHEQVQSVWKLLDKKQKELYVLPSAQPEQRWIPCSERLPELYKDVLVCWDFKGNREVLVGDLYADGEFHGYDDEHLTPAGRKHRKAVAWMPLPEPYKERREE